MLRALLLALAAGCALPASAATKSTDPAARKLIDQAVLDLKAGKVEPAVDSLLQANKLGRDASESRTLLASVFYDLSRNDDSHRIWHLRRQARNFAVDALLIDGSDMDAQDIMTGLSGAFDQQKYQPAAAVKALSDQADMLYDARQYQAAIRKYEEVIGRDPRYPDVYVNLGDCLFQMGEKAGAEQAYRKAIELDRNYEGAWMALNKLLTRQKREKDAEAAAFGAVAALPSTIDGWGELFALLRQKDSKARRFDYKPKASYSLLRKKFLIDQDMGPIERSAWIVVANAQQAASDPAQQRSPFQILLATWTTALPELAKTDKANPVNDATLRDMLAFHQAGQLKAALFALQYKEAYRPDYEAWKKAEPDGLKRFIDTFRIVP